MESGRRIMQHGWRIIPSIIPSTDPKMAAKVAIPFPLIENGAKCCNNESIQSVQYIKLDPIRHSIQLGWFISITFD